jgi:hypothetical protein
MSSKKSSDVDVDFEQALYAMLNSALHRAECAGKAIARVEYDIVQKHQVQLVEAQHAEPAAEDLDPVDPEEQEERPDPEAEAADQASREFNSTQFQSMFFNLNALKLLEDLVKLIGLEALEEEVLHVVMHDLFRPRTGGSKRGGDGQTFIGSDTDMLFHNLRKIAAQRQRGRG